MFNPKDKIQFNEDACYTRNGVDFSGKIGTVEKVYPNYFKGRSIVQGDLLIVSIDKALHKIPAALVHIYKPATEAEPEQIEKNTVSVTGEEFVKAMTNLIDLKHLARKHEGEASAFIMFYIGLGSKLAALVFGKHTDTPIELDKATLEKAVSDILSPDVLRGLLGDEISAIECLEIAVEIGPYFIKLIEHYFPAAEND